MWPDEKGAAWKTSVASNGYEVLLISQFTLHGYFSGNKPDFHLASKYFSLVSHIYYRIVESNIWYIVLVAPGPAKEYFDSFCNRVRTSHSSDKVAEGVFGAMMEVSLVRIYMYTVYVVEIMESCTSQVNDGPVTMNIDSKERKPSK